MSVTNVNSKLDGSTITILPAADVKSNSSVVTNEVMKYISSMDSDTTRWMNKRRPKNSAAIPRHIMPGIAIQLKELFDNIDVDQSGEIDLTELKQAVKFVADACPEIGGKCYSAQDTKAITNFFRSMDVNHNGVVDFVEFLAAVTASQSNGDNDGNNNTNNDAEKIAQASHRLQASFIQFATQLRRQRLAKNLFNDHLTSTEKIDALKQRYSINYFMDVGLEEGGAITSADKQWQALNGNVLHERKKRELQRAREAASVTSVTNASRTCDCVWCHGVTRDCI